MLIGKATASSGATALEWDHSVGLRKWLCDSLLLHSTGEPCSFNSNVLSPCKSHDLKISETEEKLAKIPSARHKHFGYLAIVCLSICPSGLLLGGSDRLYLLIDN